MKIIPSNAFNPSESKNNVDISALELTKKSETEMLHTYSMLPNIDRISQETLVKHLTKITKEYRNDKDYYKIRKQYIAISMALNQKGLLAPAFRKNQPSIPKLKGGYDNAIGQLLIDQIVIDCHWLHCRKEVVIPKWETLSDLFNPELEFDAEMISVSLGKRNWKREFRANDMLGLTPFQQNQLRMLSDINILIAHKIIFEGYMGQDGRTRISAAITPIRRAVRSWAERVHQIRGHQEMYEALWAARKMLGKCTSNTQIAKLAGYIVGRPPLERTTIISKFKSLDRMLGSAAVN